MPALLAPMLMAVTLTFGSLAPTATTASPTPATSSELSLPAFWSQQFEGRDLKLVKTLTSNSAYTRHAVTYRSGKFRISGVMNIPKGSGPFPVVILAHGYIDPKIYKSGQGLAREQDYLARRGFVAFHTDYRDHAQSDRDPANADSLRIGYVEDVINAALAVKSSSIPGLDPQRVSLLGRSMGGGIAYNALVSRPGLFDAAVIYASVSTKAEENTAKFMRSNPQARDRIYAKYGTPKQNPKFWAQMSSITFFDRISDPILVHHGTADGTCPIVWADTAVKRLKALGKDVTYRTYQGSGHTFYSEWTLSMRRTVSFLEASDRS
jgi:dipeptidyl aminopeptidase/acylaminoacyl peptidase